MSSCYQFYKVSLTNFCHPKFFFFRKLYADMNIFRKFGSKKKSKGVIGESSDSDVHPRRLAEVRSCEWPHTPFLEEDGTLQEFMQYAANDGLTNFIADECEQHQILTNIFVRSFTFLPRNNPPKVCFDLYAENHQIPLTEFCDICMIPSDGSLAEPMPAGFEAFYRTLAVGDERGCQPPRLLAYTFLPYITLFYLLLSACLLEMKWVCSAHQTLLFYAEH